MGKKLERMELIVVLGKSRSSSNLVVPRVRTAAVGDLSLLE